MIFAERKNIENGLTEVLCVSNATFLAEDSTDNTVYVIMGNRKFALPDITLDDIKRSDHQIIRVDWYEII